MGQVLEMNTTLRHLLFLLEYCMVTGYDWWDVLLHVQPTMVHNLVEKLHEEYMRQNLALQQVRVGVWKLLGIISSCLKKPSPGCNVVVAPRHLECCQ